MLRRITYLAVAIALAHFASDCCRAEIKVKAAVVRGAAAGERFQLEGIPAPSATDAANGAKLSLLSGRRDPNGGELRALHDGQLPAHDDQPRRNFFFAAGSEGGRLLMDLGEPAAVQQVNTYSWHRSERGPQVYKLYGGDGTAERFTAAPEADADPARFGWKLLAEVDTRAQGEAAGGQYGVAIADDQAATLGTFRYLLFDIAPTERDDPFGHTFFSEIDVHDGHQHAPPPAPEGIEVVKVPGDYEIVFDTSEMPEIRRWVAEKLKPTCVEWYPKIVELLPSDDYTPPKRFTIVFHKDMRGVANAGGGQINCAGSWFMRNLNGEAAGAVVHEMVHIVQQYRRTRGGSRNPSWMVEGVADYIRWFLYEPEANRPRVNPSRANYDDSYRTTAAFLNYVVTHHDEEIVKRFNADMRRGNYREELWEQYTGKKVGELWSEFVATLE